MSWVKLDDNFPDHPKIEDTSDAAFRLHVSAMCHCARNLTDGFVSRTRVRKLTSHDDPESIADELVKAGLWHMTDGGWQIHDYLDYNPSAVQVQAERQKTKARVQRWRQAHKGDVNAVTNAVTDPVSDAVGTAAVTGAPTRPDPTRPVVPSELQEQRATPSSSTSAEPPREDVEALCTRLRDRMVANGFKPPTITADWRNQARLLLDKDGRNVELALRLIDWACADEFWHPNIKSMGKFRAQYDTLLARARQDRDRRRAAAGTDRISGWQALKQTGTEPHLRALPTGGDPC